VCANAGRGGLRYTLALLRTRAMTRETLWQAVALADLNKSGPFSFIALNAFFVIFAYCGASILKSCGSNPKIFAMSLDSRTTIRDIASDENAAAQNTMAKTKHPAPA
jgi:hypothetical protein